MKKNICSLVTISLFLLLFACGKDKESASTSDGGGPATTGYATQNGGTTGGNGSTLVTATTFAELKQYLENSITPYVVKINSRIYNGIKGGRIKVQSNKTLIGEGSGAFLDGVGLWIAGTKNIIIRNVKFSMVSITDRVDPAVYDPDGDEGRPQIIVNGGDCINIENSSNIWIDHCEFFSENPFVQTNTDLYDGLIDVKGSSAFLTISWNYFHDHHKCHLIGAAETDNYDRRITFHHNYYRNVRSRLPSYRFGTGHVVNNYFLNAGSSGSHSRMGACLKVEANVYENVKTPVWIETSILPGKLDLVNNQYINISGTPAPTVSTCTAAIPYTFGADAVTDVKAKVVAGAGVGKL